MTKTNISTEIRIVLYGNTLEIMQKFGGAENLKNALQKLQNYLYDHKT